MEPAIVVAIVNTNPDLVRILRTAIEQAGFLVVVVHIEEIKTGQVDVRAFLRDTDPKVIVYDVAPPYDRNWQFLDHIRSHTDFEGRRFVITTVNAARVHEIVGTDETVYEVVGRREDVDQIVRAVKEASRARATR